uniref:Uncharacterized protein n=1 Tax=Arundo donax TaxID=35708 RepID=A0A0A9GQ24_ARUDO
MSIMLLFNRNMLRFHYHNHRIHLLGLRQQYHLHLLELRHYQHRSFHVHLLGWCHLCQCQTRATHIQ